MITKRKLYKKLELLIYRQNLLATVVFKTSLNRDSQEKLEKQWNDLYTKIMEK